MKYQRIALVAAFLLLGACGSDRVTSVDAAISGSLSFNYTGGGGGSFSATGAITSAALSSSPFTTTWATGYKEAGVNSTNIGANIPRSSTTSDITAITIKGQSTGTYTIDANCQETSTSTCNDVTLLTAQTGGGTTFGNACSLTAGSITISTLSSANAVGSFSGSGTCFTQTGTSTTWIVTNGSFNVPLLSTPPSSLP